MSTLRRKILILSLISSVLKCSIILSYLTQPKYAFDIIVRVDLTNSKTVSTLVELEHLKTQDSSLVSLNLSNTHFSYFLLIILQYLKDTLNHALTFLSYSSLTLQEYTDANWTGDPTGRRSINRFCFFLDIYLISWHSKKQTIASWSCTKTKIASAIQELI